jgi:hypothetical protein
VARAATQSIAGDASTAGAKPAGGDVAGKAGAGTGSVSAQPGPIQLDKDVFWVAAKSADRLVGCGADISA